MTFKEPMHKIVDRVKNEPYFRWSNKMGGDPSRRNQILYCTYLKDKGHTTEQCQVLKDHLEQLVKVGYLKELVVDPENRGTGQGAQQRGNPLPLPLGVIEVIHVALKGPTIAKRGVLTVVPMGNCAGEQSHKKKMRIGRELITFGKNDLEGTVQPHDDVLVVTARISSFLVKRVMVDQGSGADVMCPNLFKGLRLKSRDLSKYDTPLVEFDGRIVVPEGQISLPINMEGKEVMVAFIVVNSFSLYTVILGWSWIHAMGAIPSTLYVKVKFPTEQGIILVKGSQQVARQCLVAAVNRKNEQVEQKGNVVEASL